MHIGGFCFDNHVDHFFCFLNEDNLEKEEEFDHFVGLVLKELTFSIPSHSASGLLVTCIPNLF